MSTRIAHLGIKWRIGGVVGAALLLGACGAGGLWSLSGPAGPAGLPRTLVTAVHQPPLAPADLRVLGPDGQPLAAESWTNQAELQLAAALSSPERGVTLVPEAEIRPIEQPLTGTPNASGASGATTIPVPAEALLPGHRHHWQVRAREVGGKTGPWAAFPGTVGFAPTPPAAPLLAPLPNDGYTTQRQVRLEWTADAGEVGIAGYAFVLDRRPDAGPPPEATAAEPAVTLAVLEDGDWFVRVWALDRAGNWSEPATTALHVDSTPLRVTDARYRTAAFHPAYGTLPIRFMLSRPADVTVTILPAGSDEAVRTYALGTQQDAVAVEWDGEDESGAAVPAGSYRFLVQATDRAGSHAEALYDRLSVTQKRIMVSLGQQTLWAYDGGRLFLSTLVTTGGPQLPTPAGTFSVQAKYAPFTFKSPWPKGSPYWYPDSPASFAMLFEDGGYFIHDAPWRGRFGPGSNTVIGTPGGDTTGTHGCINVPYAVAARLFAWAEVGTPVVVS